ncbi:MAG: radical SAM protein [Nitrospinae bacterium]|nr:radical SAM protein [Nitrospinota bacterium]
MKTKAFFLNLMAVQLGCPYQCIYCDQKAATGADLYQKESLFPETVRKWLSYKKKTPPLSQIQIAFYGGSFTSLSLEEQSRLLAQVRPFLLDNTAGSLRISARPDSINEEILTLLWNSGVRTVELGVQSLDGDVLRLSGRGYKPEAVYSSVELLQARNFKIGLQLMPGLPGDTREKFFQTVEGTVRLRPGFTRIYPAIVLKGTPLERLYQKDDYSPLTLEEAVDWCAEGVSRFRAASIDVIRLGLQPTESIRSEANVVAGPFHPAFGQLVESRIALGRMIALFSGLKIEHEISAQKNFVFLVPARELSNYRGQHNGNLVKLRDYFGREFEILADQSITAPGIL